MRLGRCSLDGHLFCDADIEDAVWEFLLKAIQASTASHCSVDGDDALVPLSFRDQGVRKEIGVAWRLQHYKM